jgi:hypothetical protein
MITRVVGSRNRSPVGTHPAPGVAAWAWPRRLRRWPEPEAAAGPASCGRHAGTMAVCDAGVSTVFVSLPDLAHPDDVLRLAPVTAAFA